MPVGLLCSEDLLHDGKNPPFMYESTAPANRIRSIASILEEIRWGELHGCRTQWHLHSMMDNKAFRFVTS